jgi:hypothetical protein
VIWSLKYVFKTRCSADELFGLIVRFFGEGDRRRGRWRGERGEEVTSTITISINPI